MTDSELKFAAAGDAMISRRLSPREDDELERLVGKIRDADTALVNLETTIHDFEGYPSGTSGMYMCSPPWAADELSWMGFDLFAAATNHTGDYSHGGMEATMRELDRRDLSYAGLGRNLADARSPAYLETPAGRVALVSACSTYTAGNEAGPTGPDVRGRPGISPLGFTTQYEVPPGEFDSLRRLSERLGLEDIKRRNEDLGIPSSDTDDRFSLYNVAGDDFTFERGQEYGYRRTVDEDDANAVLDRIRAAERQADWVVASLHSHEGMEGHFGDQTVPPFVESFARDCIDAGADAFVGHGPHVIRGIEVYDDRPIFYSLGDFILQEETVPKLPGEMYRRHGFSHDASPADIFDEREEMLLALPEFWETFVPVCRFSSDGIDGITIHPIDLAREESRSSRGTPRMATGDTADRILEQLAALSSTYDTEITVKNGVGTVEL